MIARNYSQIVKEINDKVTLAVKDTADEMQIKLKEFIQENIVCSFNIFINLST